jgi:hypothetical protein
MFSEKTSVSFLAKNCVLIFSRNLPFVVFPLNLSEKLISAYKFENTQRKADNYLKMEVLAINLF